MVGTPSPSVFTIAQSAPRSTIVARSGKRFCRHLLPCDIAGVVEVARNLARIGRGAALRSDRERFRLFPRQPRHDEVTCGVTSSGSTGRRPLALTIRGFRDFDGPHGKGQPHDKGTLWCRAPFLKGFLAANGVGELQQAQRFPEGSGATAGKISGAKDR
jgi:hypothetical protein